MELQLSTQMGFSSEPGGLARRGLAQFRYDRSKDVPVEQQRELNARLRADERNLVDKLDERFAEIDALTAQIRIDLSLLESKFRAAELACVHAEAAVDQAEADYRVIMEAISYWRRM